MIYSLRVLCLQEINWEENTLLAADNGNWQLNRWKLFTLAAVSVAAVPLFSVLLTGLWAILLMMMWVDERSEMKYNQDFCSCWAKLDQPPHLMRKSGPGDL